MRASDAKKFIGKMVEFRKDTWWKSRYGVVEETAGRNILIGGDWHWAADIITMKPYTEGEKE